MATLKALWTEVVHVNVAWYEEYVGRLEAECKLEGLSKVKKFEKARSEGRQQLIAYSENKLPQNFEQLFHLAGVFRGYRGLARHITDIDGRLTFISMFPRNVNEGLTNALLWNEDGTRSEESEEDDATELA